MIGVVVEDGVMALWTGKGVGGPAAAVTDSERLFGADVCVTVELDTSSDETEVSSDMLC
jgi:hypothetical protein